MPAYLYKCGKCGNTFEVIKEMSRAHIVETCLKCGEKKSVTRDFKAEKKSCFMRNTVGGLADRNSDRMSDDEKLELQRKTKRGE